MAQLKFYKLAVAPTGVSQGAIWFNTTDRTINVYTGSAWEKYAGLVDAALSNDGKLLTITNAAGTEIKLDLSDVASLSSVNSTVARLEGLIQANATAAANAQSAAEGAQAHSEGVAGDLAAEVATRGTEITRVEGLVSAEATTARAAEQANAAAAKAADDKATAAQTYAEGVNTALGQEVTRATDEEARIAGLVGAEESRAKAEEERLAGLIATAASGATTEVAKDANASHITVTASTGSNGQKVYTIGESDIASAQGLADEISRASAAEQGLAGRIDALDAADTGRVSVLEAKIEALSSATHFIGVKDALPETAADGDIVIVGEKEYIYDSTHDPKWVELGDTTAEANRISALEGWKTTAAQSIADNTAAIESNDSDILVLQNRAQAIENNITNNIATKQELADEKSALNALISANKTAIESNDADIKNLQEKDGEFQEWIDAHEDAFEALTGVVNGKVAQGDFDALAGRVATAEGDIDALEGEVAGLKEADTTLNDAIQQVAADLANKNVAAEGDTYVTASAANNKVTVAANVSNTIADNVSALATVKAVYDAMAWASFE